VAETCAGNRAACPADRLVSARTVCRPPVDTCDPAETCSGSAATCPADITHCGQPIDAGIDSGSDATVCECSGTGPDGPVTVTCGNQACGQDHMMYLCGDIGWSWTGQACPAPPDAGPCSCGGTGPGGLPVTAACGETVCGSDLLGYTCSASGWVGTTQECNCKCTGTGPGGVPVTVYCGQSACGSDHITYGCSVSGWSSTQQSCTSDASVPGCQCTGAGPGDVPVTVNCG